MSSSRAISGAQRRRAGPPEPPQRGPNTSINSSQVFSQQGAKVMNNVNIPNGKIAGQQAALSQAQMMQQKAAAMKQKVSQQQQPQFEKMTIPQAISLITLRLGKVEAYIQENNFGTTSGSSFNEDGTIDMQSILARLESLEKRSVSAPLSGSSSTSSTEISNIKTQLEVLKPAVMSIKSSTTKDMKEMKQQIDILQSELNLVKEQLEQLREESTEHSKQIMAITMGVELDTAPVDFNGEEEEEKEEQDENVVELDGVETEDIDDETSIIHGNDLSMTMNLKDLIKQELSISDI